MTSVLIPIGCLYWKSNQIVWIYIFFPSFLWLSADVRSLRLAGAVRMARAKINICLYWYSYKKINVINFFGLILFLKWNCVIRIQTCKRPQYELLKKKVVINISLSFLKIYKNAELCLFETCQLKVNFRNQKLQEIENLIKKYYQTYQKYRADVIKHYSKFLIGKNKGVISTFRKVEGGMGKGYHSSLDDSICYLKQNGLTSC